MKRHKRAADYYKCPCCGESGHFSTPVCVLKEVPACLVGKVPYITQHVECGCTVGLNWLRTINDGAFAGHEAKV